MYRGFKQRIMEKGEGMLGAQAKSGKWTKRRALVNRGLLTGLMEVGLPASHRERKQKLSLSIYIAETALRFPRK